MATRYYPSSKVMPDLTTQGNQFTDINGVPYKGKYYLTYTGKAFSGPNPQTGPNQPLKAIKTFIDAPGLSLNNLNEKQRNDLASKTGLVQNRVPGKPMSYFPRPTDDDYRKGYITRYFTKKENEIGFITEISQTEYNNITNGLADYDISIYQVTKILWKLTGPLRSQRQSQYNVIPGIIDTNQRLTETANKTFLGIVDFIGGDYAKFAKPTA